MFALRAPVQGVCVRAHAASCGEKISSMLKNGGRYTRARHLELALHLFPLLSATGHSPIEQEIAFKTYRQTHCHRQWFDPERNAAGRTPRPEPQRRRKTTAWSVNFEGRGIGGRERVVKESVKNDETAQRRWPVKENKSLAILEAGWTSGRTSIGTPQYLYDLPWYGNEGNRVPVCW